MNFVHLHVHTEYSLLDGLSKIPDLVVSAKEFGQKAIAITDHGNMYGAIEFYKKCKEEEIKPIIGCEMYVSSRSRFDKEPGKDFDRNHLIVLAKNKKGYKNLMKLSTAGYLDGYYYRPRIDHEILKEFHEGLIISTACLKGEIPSFILNNQYEEAKKSALWYLELFKDDFYLEMQNHEYQKCAEANSTVPQIKQRLMEMADAQEKVKEGLLKLSRELGIPLIATNDLHYVHAEDAQAQDALLAIQTNTKLTDTNRLRYIDTPNLYLKSGEEMSKLFPNNPEFLDLTNQVADKCELEIEIGKWHFPNFSLPDNKTPEIILQETANTGLTQRFEKVTPELQDRLNYELDIICKKGYATYFLIVAGFAKFCNENSIITNTRGSAAGSLVSYCCYITNVNPMFYKLPFERFLNPYRPSPPDIDFDIADNRRNEVIAYITQKYGAEKVAQIATFGRMLAKQAVRDIGRAASLSFTQTDRISKMIPLGSQGFPMTLSEALRISPELKNIYDTEPDIKYLIDLSQRVEGCARHVSVHAAGLVISPTELTDFSPLQREIKDPDKIMTQYEMHSLEDVGLIKMDLLGIRNLSILGEAVVIIKRVHGKDIDLNDLPINDNKTYDLLARGETMGVFQLGSNGMIRYLKDLKPSNIFDIMAMVALFRPGPMASIPEFIQRKHQPGKTKYFDPRMADFLKESYGVIVYQDDVLLTAIHVAGYNWEEADKFRKAIGKKIPKEMAKQKEKFINGAVKNGLTQEKAEELFKLIEPFSGYGFNKAHAASYAQIAYQTAYVKAHYPVEYMTAMLTAEAGNTEKVVAAVTECQRMGIKVLLPDINKSGTEFTIEDNNIRFGLSAIKNVGQAAIDAIFSARKNGNFTSLADFMARVDGQKVNKKTVESLIRTGAMDIFGKRASQMVSLEKIRTAADKHRQNKESGQNDLFGSQEENDGNFDHPLDDIPEWDKKILLDFERELLGFYLTENPFQKEMLTLHKIRSHSISEIKTDPDSSGSVVIGGIIKNVKTITTKNNNSLMAIITLEDDSGANIEVVIFPKIYEKFKSILYRDSIIVVNGKVDKNEDRISILAEKVSLLDDNISTDTVSSDSMETIPLNNSEESTYSITIPTSVTKNTLNFLNTLLKENKGDDKLILKFGERTISVPYGVNYSQELKDKIDKLIS